MDSSGLDLARARILVTNDDGISAPGLEVLERIARACSKDVWVVAPHSEQSAASHSLTLRRPLRVREISRRRFSVDGTPTDCVLVAQRKILAERTADIVLSGINQGANLGEDVSYSGTVAAAKEGASLGVPAVAFSQVRTPAGDLHWETAERFGVEVLQMVASFAWRKGLLINVNFPPIPCAAVTGVRVHAGIVQHQIGSEVPEQRGQGLVQNLQIHRIGGSGRQTQIIIALLLARRKILLAVHAEGKHIGLVLKNKSGSIALMHIQINHQNLAGQAADPRQPAGVVTSRERRHRPDGPYPFQSLCSAMTIRRTYQNSSATDANSWSDAATCRSSG